ncbi:hypothetical protein P43SY_005172 [Pythium insidiosum]|uniref:Uncharacterized protein n=1 Tax=Pythium insidiosum TaxID=114742 RepID=A0AAD5QBV4_PYTIN|nr:hypothetical protein P43SY_005172 [Pythium insidiosum]
MTREVWFQLVDGEGNAVTSADCVDCADDAKVVDLQDAVKEKNKDSHLAGIAASDLTVFANGVALDPRDSLAGIDEEETLIVEVPRRESDVPAVHLFQDGVNPQAPHLAREELLSRNSKKNRGDDDPDGDDDRVVSLEDARVELQWTRYRAENEDDEEWRRRSYEDAEKEENAEELHDYDQHRIGDDEMEPDEYGEAYHYEEHQENGVLDDEDPSEAVEDVGAEDETMRAEEYDTSRVSDEEGEEYQHEPYEGASDTDGVDIGPTQLSPSSRAKLFALELTEPSWRCSDAEDQEERAGENEGPTEVDDEAGEKLDLDEEADGYELPVFYELADPIGGINGAAEVLEGEEDVDEEVLEDDSVDASGESALGVAEPVGDPPSDDDDEYQLGQEGLGVRSAPEHVDTLHLDGIERLEQSEVSAIVAKVDDEAEEQASDGVDDEASGQSEIEEVRGKVDEMKKMKEHEEMEWEKEEEEEEEEEENEMAELEESEQQQQEDEEAEEMYEYEKRQEQASSEEEDERTDIVLECDRVIMGLLEQCEAK